MVDKYYENHGEQIRVIEEMGIPIEIKGVREFVDAHLKVNKVSTKGNAASRKEDSDAEDLEWRCPWKSCAKFGEWHAKGEHEFRDLECYCCGGPHKVKDCKERAKAEKKSEKELKVNAVRTNFMCFDCDAIFNSNADESEG